MPIVTYRTSNPMVDGRQSDRALAIARGVGRLFGELGVALIAEMPLASGRRADLIGIDRKGRFTIIEIKSSLEDFRADGKWPDYRQYCDYFYFATLADVPAEIFPDQEGLIVADGHGAEIIREAELAALAGATRRALTLRFARAGATRLDRVLRFAEGSGLETPDDLHAIDGE